MQGAGAIEALCMHAPGFNIHTLHLHSPARIWKGEESAIINNQFKIIKNLFREGG